MKKKILIVMLLIVSMGLNLISFGNEKDFPRLYSDTSHASREYNRVHNE